MKTNLLSGNFELKERMSLEKVFDKAAFSKPKKLELLSFREYRWIKVKLFIKV